MGRPLVTVKFPIKIHRLEHENCGQFKVAMSLEKAQSNFQQAQRHSQSIELDYDLTITEAGAVLQRARKSFRKDPRVYWHLARILDGFLNRLDAGGLYLPHAYKNFAQDLGFSTSSVEKIFLFYRRFADVSSIDPNIPWERYRNNEVKMGSLETSPP